MDQQQTNQEANGADRGPPRTGKWPPAWLQSAPATQAAAPVAVAPQPAEDEVIAKAPESRMHVTASGGQQCPRCGSTEFVYVAISGGRTRQDCARCGRFIDFPVW